MRIRRRFDASELSLACRSRRARRRALSVARGVLELVSMIRRERGRFADEQERQLAELGAAWATVAYRHGRGALLLAEVLGPGWHYDPSRCDCGGSGWRPGIPDDECCPYHGEPNADEAES